MTSVIIPIYNEPYAEVFHKILLRALPKGEYEIVFVDDGSEVHLDLPGITLTRNFGAHAAVAAGLSVCKGDRAVVMSGDGQDPYYMIPILASIKWDVVFAVDEPQLVSKIYRLITRTVTGGMFCISRDVIDDFNKLPFRCSSLYTSILSLGYGYETVPYIKNERIIGKSKWTLADKFKLLFDSFSVGRYYYEIK